MIVGYLKIVDPSPSHPLLMFSLFIWLILTRKKPHVLHISHFSPRCLFRLKKNDIKNDIDSMFASQLISLIASIESDQLGEDA